MPIGRSAGSGVSNRRGGMLSLGRTWAVKSLGNPGSTRRWRQRLSSGDRVGDLTVLGSSAPYRIPARGPRLRNLALLLGHAGIAPACPGTMPRGPRRRPQWCRPLGAARQIIGATTSRLAEVASRSPLLLPAFHKATRSAGPVCGYYLS